MLKTKLALAAIPVSATAALGLTVAPAVADVVNPGHCMSQIAQGAGTGNPSDYASGQTGEGNLTISANGNVNTSNGANTIGWFGC